MEEKALLALVIQQETKHPMFADDLEALKKWLAKTVAAHLGVEAAEALGASIAAQILGKKPGYDPDRGMDA